MAVGCTDRASRSRFRWVQKNLASTSRSLYRLRFGAQEQTPITSLGGREYIGILAPSSGDDDTYTQAYAHKLCLKTGGVRSCWAARYMYTRSEFNYIYTIEGSDALLRVQKRPRDREMYLRELESNRVLARAGLSPAVYATVFLRVLSDEEESMPVGKEDGMSVGVVLERYEASLEDLDSRSIETLFLEHDAEDALVDLYAHAAAYVRCVDTKPANVVWKLGDDGAPVLGLIDVDPAFCGASSDPRSTLAVVPLAGRAGVSGLRRALASTTVAALQVKRDGKARVARVAQVPALLVAALSLLVFCVEAATGAPGDTYPFIRIAEALLEYSAVIDALLELDGNDEAFPRATARSRLIHYCDGYFLRTEGEGTCDWRRAIRDALVRPATLALVAARPNPEKEEGPSESDDEGAQPGRKKRKKRKSARRRGCKTPRSPPRKRRAHHEGART